MKITDVEIFQLGSQATGSATWAANSIILRLTTSDGLQGYGEAVPTLRVQPVIQSLKEVARVYKGKDPFETEKNMNEWAKHDFYLPVSFESTTALSAFDIACWDLIGKHFGEPVYRLLGGKLRDRVRLYLNGWYADCVKPEQFAVAARRWNEKGYSALKFDPFGAAYDDIDQKQLEDAYSRVKAVRDATDGKVQLLIEHHGRFGSDAAIRIAEKFEQFSPLFMEEPVHPEDIEGLRKYRSRVKLKVALGERLINIGQVLLMLRENLVDYLQVDLANIGGITRAVRVSKIAEAFDVRMAFHNAFGPIQNAATIQVDASISNFLIQESFFDCFPSWKRALVKSSPHVISGYSAIPDRPGLGVEVDEKVLESHRVDGQEYFNPDEPVWVVKGTWKDL
ncbi:MAG: mandelate racemase/muconate lactonizing enzyme family protein [Conexivisphaerales archaeon]